eukprot:362018-Chlamydomonas_euryale.AAC.18
MLTIHTHKPGNLHAERAQWRADMHVQAGTTECMGQSVPQGKPSLISLTRLWMVQMQGRGGCP